MLQLYWLFGLSGQKAKYNIIFNQKSIVESVYRPFLKQYLYFNRDLNERIYQQPKAYPTSEHKNVCIAVSGIGSGKDFSTLIVNQVPCLDMVEKGQCFPLYYYEENKGNSLLSGY